MNNKTLSLAILALGITTGVVAQSKEKTPAPEKKKKEESITIRKKAGSNEKTTIVIDGDNITVNGKPLSELHDADVEVLRNKEFAPMMKFRMPEGGAKMFGEGFPFGGGNKAMLGVGSTKDEKGAKVKTVEKESAADKAGLKQDDIITKVGDNKIEGSDDLYDAIGKFEPGDKVNITYLRDGKEAQTSATLGENKTKPRVFSFNGDDMKEFEKNFNFKMPAPGHPDWNEDFVFNRKPRLGMAIQDQADGKGVKVIDVDEDAAAEKAGLKKDDVITAVDGKAVNSVDELKSSIKELKEGDSIKLTYLRAGKSQTATISFPKKLKTAEL